MLNPDMLPSDACYALIEGFEELFLYAYLDPERIPTIGWGHTKGVKIGDTCTEAQAQEWCVEDVSDAASIVRSAVKVALNQNQFDALVSFTFNVGPGEKGVKPGFVIKADGSPSTILNDLNAGNFSAAAAQLPRWNHAGGVVLRGLTRRRAAEQALFEKPVIAQA